MTFGVAAAVGTLTVPTGVELFHARINGDDGDVSANQFTVRVTFSGSEYNTSDSDALFPKAMLWDRTPLDFGGPTSGLPYNLRDAGDVGVSVECVALGSVSMDILFKGVTFTDWTIVLDF